MTTMAFVLFKLLTYPSLTSCMVNLHSQCVFQKIHMPNYIQPSLGAVDGDTHYYFIMHVLSLFYITVRQLY